MKKRDNCLISITPALEGVFHVATIYTSRGYKAKGVSGRNIEYKRLRKL